MSDRPKPSPYPVGGIRPGISRREGHMEPADRRAAALKEEKKDV